MALLLGGACLLAPSTSKAAPTLPGQLVNPITSSSNCEFCHGYENALTDELAPDYAPLRTWQGSMMANSARDPVFWAGVAVADGDSPGDTILCVRCHSPRAFLEGNGSATAIEDLTPDQQDGVECELCHRMTDDGVTAPGNAQYVIDDQLGVDLVVPRRGPWSYDDGVPLPPHGHLPDGYLGTSRLCGTCHDVTTDTERVDDAGVGMGTGFNEQRTYSEWLGSAYAVPGPNFASCQDCHMPAVADKPGCTSNLNQYTHATGGRRHDLVGANRFMVQVMKSEYGSAGANLIADRYFDNTLAAMDELLPTAATLELQGPTEVDLAMGLPELAVTVTNDTGHKLPTGYSEGREMWLEVVVEYAGEVVYGSGRWDPATGIERDPQLRTYRAIGERWSDGTTLHLLLNDHWQEDTRIPPRGLLPDPQTDPVGDRYALQPDGTWPHFDEHVYAFPGAPRVVDVTPGDDTDDELLVTVRLRYLINSPEYVDFLASNAGDAGLHVATLFELEGGAPALVITEQTLAIPIVNFGTPPGTSGADTTGGGSTAGETTSTQSGGTMPPGGSTGQPGGTTDRTDGTAGSSSGDVAGASDDGGEGCACHGSGRGGPAWSWLPWVVLTVLRTRTAGPRRRRRRDTGTSWACSTRGTARRSGCPRTRRRSPTP
ncbi:multiheme c-type cytochrome [Paraliomyxa miuraensis]|uniref:multiheme c-type cytochrome n=1 Tax=Paraliomyxa miuraensis TaxID=376150 RepID=UPI00224F9605|nr:multiheme c-type cytochrome [Paraliomyxa miuraensis]MCX4242460.1 cytochrome c family protein [Paraliomyxa miuraensis]